MSILQTYLQAWKKTFNYKNRSTRKEYWTFTLLSWAIMAAIILIGMPFGIDLNVPDPTFSATVLIAVFGVFFFATLFPMLSIAVRRLHDINFRGWWLLIQIIPYAGALVIFIFLLLDGTHGENRFGPDPKNRPQNCATNKTTAA
jgi:uncharacterized membrane protein YhaH (DUF805 family)